LRNGGQLFNRRGRRGGSLGQRHGNRDILIAVGLSSAGREAQDYEDTQEQLNFDFHEIILFWKCFDRFTRLL
jgi:hypothetical protein